MTHEGNFHSGFYGSIGWSNVLHVEIQALLIGIKLCWQAGFKKVICYSDSLHVVKLVTMETHRYHHYANMVEIIKDYMKKDWSFLLKHTLREGNACADILANMGANLETL